MQAGPDPDPNPHDDMANGYIPNAPSLITKARATFEHGFAKLMQELFARIDDELFNLSDKADSSGLQSLYFETMRLVRREKDLLQANCLNRVFTIYDAFCNLSGTAPPPSGDTSPETSSGRDLRLLENDALEIELAVRSTEEKGNALFQSALHELVLRFSALLGLRQFIETSDHPLAPRAICRAFADNLAPLQIDISVRLLLLKLFDRHVLTKLGPIYDDVNALLAAGGVLPTIAPRLPYPRPRPPAVESSDVQPPSLQEDDENHLINLLSIWRQRSGRSSVQASQDAEPISPFDAAEVVSALNLLQTKISQLPAGDGSSVLPLKQSLSDHLAESLPHGERRRLGQFEEDVMDMVSMIFDFILEDHNLPDPVKALIARLQIPVVKVAIIERSFLAKRTHPLRQLLNTLAQAGIGLAPNDKKDLIVLRKIEEVVYRILTEFDEDTHLFAILLDDFSAFMAREGIRVKAMEERVRQTTESQERLALAKRAAAIEITTLMQERSVPPAIISLLLNAWKDVLVIAFLRKDKDGGDWDNAVSLMYQIADWAAHIGDGVSPAKEQVSGADIMQAVREKLENISFDPVQIQALLKDIESWQSSRGAHVDAHSMDAGAPGPAGWTDETAADAAFEPSQAGAILVEDLIVEGIAPEPAEAEAQDDDFLEQARNLGIGDWVEFSDHQGLPFRGKLLLKSQHGARYIFVNRRGMKIREIGLRELAHGLARASIRLIAGTNEPLLDRAFNTVIDTLERSAATLDPKTLTPQTGHP